MVVAAVAMALCWCSSVLPVRLMNPVPAVVVGIFSSAYLSSYFGKCLFHYSVVICCFCFGPASLPTQPCFYFPSMLLVCLIVFVMVLFPLHNKFNNFCTMIELRLSPK